MNYVKIYDDFMISRLLMKSIRISEKKCGTYFEGHHIIPKSKGGSGNSNRPKNNNNIVLLTAREHFLAHWLLWNIHRDRQTALAFHKMISTNNKQKRIISSRAYEEARMAFRITNIGNQFGKGKKRIVSEEQKQKQSEIMKGRYSGNKNPFYNRKHSKESIEKIRESKKNINKEKIWNYFGKKIVLKNNEVIGIFETTKEVANFIGCTESNVKNVLGGNQKTAKGFQIQHQKKINYYHNI